MTLLLLLNLKNVLFSTISRPLKGGLFYEDLPFNQQSTDDYVLVDGGGGNVVDMPLLSGQLSNLYDMNMDFRSRLAFEYFVSTINTRRKQDYNLTKLLTTSSLSYGDRSTTYLLARQGKMKIPVLYQLV